MVTSRAVCNLRCSFLEQNFWSWSVDHFRCLKNPLGNLSESCLILLWKAGTREKVRGQKGCKKTKARWRFFVVRAFPPLSHVYLARYSSTRPVMQARHRLRGGRGGGSTLLFMLSLLSVCSIKGAVSRNSAKLGNYKMPVKLRET